MSSHPILVWFGWYLLSGVMNAALSFKSPEEWETFVARNPRGAALIKGLRKIGFDLPGLLRIVLPALKSALGRAGDKAKVE